MKRIVILTGHFPDQKRRGSILFVSDALRDRGWHVTHVTVGYSWLSRLRGDPRLSALDDPPASGLRRMSARHDTLFGYAPIHPFSTRNPALDQALVPLHRLFAAYWAPRLREVLNRARVVLVESGPPVMLAGLVRRLAPGARLVYRVNDDIRLLNAPRFLCRDEIRMARLFDRISTASPHIARRFFGHPGLRIDPMGIPRQRLCRPLPDPFPPRARREAVCAGTTQLDIGALVRVAEARPNWRLHVFGRLRCDPPRRPNLVFHGERCFDVTLAHVAHADIGLAPYIDQPGVEYQSTNSNRILLYRHFGLPVLGPDRLCHPDLPSIIGYSRPDALEQCETRRRQPERLPDWSELAGRLVQNCDTEPPIEVATSPETAT